jgi:DNA-binding transcriptional MerR regulator
MEAASHTPSGSDHVNSAEAAGICRVSRRTFNRWAADGLVPVDFTTPGGERLFRREVIEKWAREHTVSKATVV